MIELNENNPLDAADESSVWFAGFLKRLADAEVTLDDFNRLHDTCSNHTMGNEKWTDLGFANSDITHLYPKNAEVEKHNQSVLKNLKNTIIQIESNNSSAKTRKLSTNRCGKLFNVIFLASEAKVILTFNLCTDIGLANGSTGKVVDIKYRDDESPQNKNIPYYIWVDMGDYTGPPLFPHPERKKWILIYARTHTELFKKKDDWVEESRTIIPLRLDWA